MKNINYPLISCCSVVLSGKELEGKSISSFNSQSYPNRELIIIYVCDDELTEEITGLIQEPNISLFRLDKQKTDTLFFLRDFVLKRANGNYICLWEGCSWHHSARLEYQFQAIYTKGFQACILSQYLILNKNRNKVYVTNYELLEESLFFLKSIIDEIEFVVEDDNLSLFIEFLKKVNKIYLLNDVPNLCMLLNNLGTREADSNWQEVLWHSYELDAYDSAKIINVMENNLEAKNASIEIDRILENRLLEEEDHVNITKVIPKYIHLICKDKNLSENYKSFYERISTLHPDWRITIYDDSDSLKIVEEHFPELLEMYLAYPCNIQRVDIFRILIVYLKGGFYLDMDVYCLKKLDGLGHLNLVLGEERTYTREECRKYKLNSNNRQIANYMFGSIPKHPFWLEVLLEGIKRSSNVIKDENDVLATTGPWLLSDMYYKLKEQYNDIVLIRNKFRLCVKHCRSISCRFGDYAVHFHLGSWRWQSEKHYEYTPEKKGFKWDVDYLNVAHNKMLQRLKESRTK